MTPTLYRITDEYPYNDLLEVYPGLTLKEAAARMDDLTGCGEDVILADWDEPCERCRETGREWAKPTPCLACGGDGKWSGPWTHTDEETGRTVTMAREAP